MIELSWPSACPARATLQREIRACIEAWRATLEHFIGWAHIRGLYHKGSSNKPWDSQIDYVPGLSDVDLHLWLRRDSDIDRLDDIDTALAVRLEADRAFRRLLPATAHEPRPQLTILNRLLADPMYVQSPSGTVETVLGEPYPRGPYTTQEQATIRERDRAELQAHAEFIADLPLRVIDKPGDTIVSYLRQLAWRVAPTGPRVLTRLGDDPGNAWSLNRTAIVRRLGALGQANLASSYARFYLAGWGLFAAQHDAEVAATAAGECLREGVEVVRAARGIGGA